MMWSLPSVQIHPWFSPLHPSPWDLNEGQAMQTNSLNHLCLSLRRAVFCTAWAAPCRWDGAFWSTAAVPWGLGICQSCHLWRGLLAVLPKVLWVCKTARTENLGGFLWWKNQSPKGTEVVGSVELGWNAAAVGREAGEGDVVTWSSSLIPSCLCWQPAVKGGKGISGSGHLGPSLAATSVCLSQFWRFWSLQELTNKNELVTHQHNNARNASFILLCLHVLQPVTIYAFF